jgi:hypothetical protein
MCALFVDFRAAFDKVDRVKMFECRSGQGESLEPDVCGRHGDCGKE